ncbi:MAG: hypothetical protein Q8877_02920, partial [Sweet potato little leaf phytoplasma]|nr:hypothetical protein [Sweet potato little leaf phytoplasma]
SAKVSVNFPFSFWLNFFFFCDVRERTQKQKRNEEEWSRRIHELQGELASIKEERQKLERKVGEFDNYVLASIDVFFLCFDN